jgi:DNA-binding SARP family transcriptional activator
MRRRGPVGRLDLAEAIWSDAIPDAWDTSLSAIASRLRRTLEPLGSGQDAIAIRGEQGRYALRLPVAAFVDWERAREAIHEADRQVFLGNPGAALAEARVAMEIAARGFLPGENAAWILGQRDVLRDIHLRACERTVEAELARGNVAIAETEARQLLALDPLREASYRWLMRALISGGNAVQAAQVYAACRQELRARAGMSPSPETERLYMEIRGPS